MGACRGQEVIGMLARATLVTPLGRQGWPGIAVWTARTGLGRMAKTVGLGSRSGTGPYFFLPATVLRAPRRVRALVRVR